jgi:two-component system chemotaxis response regulator CheB
LIRRGERLIVLGASAGGVPAIQRVLAEMPADVGASVLITIHRHPSAPSELAGVLGRRSVLAVRDGRNGEEIVANRVYLAPPDHHMRVGNGHLVLDRGPKQHHTRPAIDPLFVSAAEHFGRGAIGAILSGNLSDGVEGLIAIKERGGLTLVQDPTEAQYPSMPRNALLYDHVDLVASAREMAPLLAVLARGGASIDDAVKLCH